MRTQFARFGRDARLVDAVERRLRTGEAEFVVCDTAGRPTGVLTAAGVFEAAKARGTDTPVVDVMANEVVLIGAGDELAQAVRLLQEKNRPAVGVVDDDARLVGLITRQTLADLMELERAGGGRRDGRAGLVTPRASA
jgi:stage IV sporulation protein FB